MPIVLTRPVVVCLHGPVNSTLGITPPVMLEFAFAALFCATLVVAPIAWYRMLVAKTQRAYLVNIALFALPILAVLALGQILGVIDFAAPPKNELPANPELPQLSGIQTLLLTAAGSIWLIGGSLLMRRHAKRMGRSSWSMMNPFKPAFRDFNAHEWISLACLAVTALLLGAIAINVGPQ